VPAITLAAGRPYAPLSLLAEEAKTYEFRTDLDLSASHVFWELRHKLTGALIALEQADVHDSGPGESYFDVALTSEDTIAAGPYVLTFRHRLVVDTDLAAVPGGQIDLAVVGPVRTSTISALGALVGQAAADAAAAEASRVQADQANTDAQGAATAVDELAEAAQTAIEQAVTEAAAAIASDVQAADTSRQQAQGAAGTAGTARDEAVDAAELADTKRDEAVAAANLAEERRAAAAQAATDAQTAGQQGAEAAGDAAAAAAQAEQRRAATAALVNDAQVEANRAQAEADRAQQIADQVQAGANIDARAEANRAEAAAERAEAVPAAGLPARMGALELSDQQQNQLIAALLARIEALENGAPPPPPIVVAPVTGLNLVRVDDENLDASWTLPEDGDGPIRTKLWARVFAVGQTAPAYVELSPSATSFPRPIALAPSTTWRVDVYCESGIYTSAVVSDTLADPAAPGAPLPLIGSLTWARTLQGQILLGGWSVPVDAARTGLEVLVDTGSGPGVVETIGANLTSYPLDIEPPAELVVTVRPVAGQIPGQGVSAQIVAPVLAAPTLAIIAPDGPHFPGDVLTFSTVVTGMGPGIVTPSQFALSVVNGGGAVPTNIEALVAPVRFRLTIPEVEGNLTIRAVPTSSQLVVGAMATSTIVVSAPPVVLPVVTIGLPSGTAFIGEPVFFPVSVANAGPGPIDELNFDAVLVDPTNPPPALAFQASPQGFFMTPTEAGVHQLSVTFTSNDVPQRVSVAATRNVTVNTGEGDYEAASVEEMVGLTGLVDGDTVRLLDPLTGRTNDLFVVVDDSGRATDGGTVFALDADTVPFSTIVNRGVYENAPAVGGLPAGAQFVWGSLLFEALPDNSTTVLKAFTHRQLHGQFFDTGPQVPLIDPVACRIVDDAYPNVFHNSVADLVPVGQTGRWRISGDYVASDRRLHRVGAVGAPGMTWDVGWWGAYSIDHDAELCVEGTEDDDLPEFVVDNNDAISWASVAIQAARDADDAGTVAELIFPEDGQYPYWGSPQLPDGTEFVGLGGAVFVDVVKTTAVRSRTFKKLVLARSQGEPMTTLRCLPRVLAANLIERPASNDVRLPKDDKARLGNNWHQGLFMEPKFREKGMAFVVTDLFVDGNADNELVTEFTDGRIAEGTKYFHQNGPYHSGISSPVYPDNRPTSCTLLLNRVAIGNTWGPGVLGGPEYESPGTWDGAAVAGGSTLLTFDQWGNHANYGLYGHFDAWTVTGKQDGCALKGARLFVNHLFFESSFVNSAGGVQFDLGATMEGHAAHAFETRWGGRSARLDKPFNEGVRIVRGYSNVPIWRSTARDVTIGPTDAQVLGGSPGVLVDAAQAGLYEAGYTEDSDGTWIPNPGGHVRNVAITMARAGAAPRPVTKISGAGLLVENVIYEPAVGAVENVGALGYGGGLGVYSQPTIPPRFPSSPTPAQVNGDGSSGAMTHTHPLVQARGIATFRNVRLPKNRTTIGLDLLPNEAGITMRFQGCQLNNVANMVVLRPQNEQGSVSGIEAAGGDVDKVLLVFEPSDDPDTDPAAFELWGENFGGDLHFPFHYEGILRCGAFHDGVKVGVNLVGTGRTVRYARAQGVHNATASAGQTTFVFPVALFTTAGEADVSVTVAGVARAATVQACNASGGAVAYGDDALKPHLKVTIASAATAGQAVAITYDAWVTPATKRETADPLVPYLGPALFKLPPLDVHVHNGMTGWELDLAALVEGSPNPCTWEVEAPAWTGALVFGGQALTMLPTGIPAGGAVGAVRLTYTDSVTGIKGAVAFTVRGYQTEALTPPPEPIVSPPEELAAVLGGGIRLQIAPGGLERVHLGTIANAYGVTPPTVAMPLARPVAGYEVTRYKERPYVQAFTTYDVAGVGAVEHVDYGGEVGEIYGFYARAYAVDGGAVGPRSHGFAITQRFAAEEPDAAEVALTKVGADPVTVDVEVEFTFAVTGLDGPFVLADYEAVPANEGGTIPAADVTVELDAGDATGRSGSIFYTPSAAGAQTMRLIVAGGLEGEIGFTVAEAGGGGPTLALADLHVYDLHNIGLAPDAATTIEDENGTGPDLSIAGTVLYEAYGVNFNAQLQAAWALADAGATFAGRDFVFMLAANVSAGLGEHATIALGDQAAGAGILFEAYITNGVAGVRSQAGATDQMHAADYRGAPHVYLVNGTADKRQIWMDGTKAHEMTGQAAVTVAQTGAQLLHFGRLNYNGSYYHSSGGDFYLVAWATFPAGEGASEAACAALSAELKARIEARAVGAVDLP
jgi:hypothetical protein